VTPAEFADKLDRVVAIYPAEMEKAQSRVGAAAVKIARKWSSGTTKLAQLAADDHPYAKRHAHSAQSGLINRQTTEKGSASFFSGWYYDVGSRALRNPHGSWLEEGTPTMVARDILGAISRDLRPIMRREQRNAIRRSLKA